MTIPRPTRLAATVLAATLVASVGACDDGTAIGPENRADSDIVAVVTADGSPLAAVTVELYARGDQTVLETATTNAAGEAAFVDLIAGTWDVEITVPTGYTVVGAGVRQTVSVERGREATVSFVLTAT